MLYRSPNLPGAFLSPQPMESETVIFVGQPRRSIWQLCPTTPKIMDRHFVHNCRGKNKKDGLLKVEEVGLAEEFLIKYEQSPIG
ncbi:hypothetical protein NPIL_316981 [Nephila pilipes]|uniref:Uncharacterized protein n=1 Tax=Nephila pilipes TaxID=299642 RepID=A0A8X6IKR6_NEPPI|nr:hypothetical protein NPIL_316981 [Nephila pilipes]